MSLLLGAKHPHSSVVLLRRIMFRIIHSLAHDTRNGRHDSVQGQHTTRRQHSETQQSHTNTSPRAHTPSNPESEARATQGTGPARPPVGRALTQRQSARIIGLGSGRGEGRGGADICSQFST